MSIVAIFAIYASFCSIGLGVPEHAQSRFHFAANCEPDFAQFIFAVRKWTDLSKRAFASRRSATHFLFLLQTHVWNVTFIDLYWCLLSQRRCFCLIILWQ